MVGVYKVNIILPPSITLDTCSTASSMKEEKKFHQIIKLIFFTLMIICWIFFLKRKEIIIEKIKFYSYIFTLICHFQIIKQKKNIVIEFILISEAKDIITFTFTFFFFFVFMLRSLTRRRLFNREGACVSLLPIYII